jgi:hypothetical protein
MPATDHIVLTTIRRPDLLEDYLTNLGKAGRLASCRVWIVGDTKTPAGVDELARSLTARGLETTYVDIEAQDRWGTKLCPKFYARIPRANETRRNIGYLMALEAGCTRLVSIDDDNWPTGDDFLGGHGFAGEAWQGPLVASDNGYFNVCSHLELTPARDVYPRGYPFRLRGAKAKVTDAKAPSGARIGVVAGLWLGDPDIDATTWLNGKVQGLSYRGPERYVLDQATWSPINTQNTSVTRALVPAYLCIPMGWPVPGGKIERYGDIWGGYFLQAMMRGTPYHVAFGRPVVDHRRNPHDYVDDLRYEFWGMILTDWLLDELKVQFKPTATRITERCHEVADFLVGSAMTRCPAWCPAEMRQFLKETATTMHAWAEACATIESSL